MNRKEEEIFIDSAVQKNIGLNKRSFNIVKLLNCYGFSWSHVPEDKDISKKLQGKLLGTCTVANESETMDNNVKYIIKKVLQEYSIETLHNSHCMVHESGVPKVRYMIVFGIKGRA